MTAQPESDEHVKIVIVLVGSIVLELSPELYNAASAPRHYGLEVFDEERLQLTLIEAGPRILPALPEKLAEAAKLELEALGVRVLTDTQVVEATPSAIVTASGERIEGDLKVWAAGVKGTAILADIGGLETTRNCQLVVRSTLQTTRDDRLFAIGDCCSYVPPGRDRPVPPRAQAAHQMASAAFANWSG